jgi:cereblon
LNREVGIELREQGGSKPGAERRPDERPQLDGTGSGKLRCSTCANLIARQAALFSMTGRDGPTVFVNPHGRVFELLTVRTAQGLFGVGGTTTAHTWFAGYAWQVVLCLQCSTHLGWRFNAASPGVSPPSFFGLIRSALVEDDTPDG